jgi:hypothetical protein
MDKMLPGEIEQIVLHCKSVLDLREAHQVDEFHYASLPLCVIDAVFSIGVRYGSTENVVRRFCAYFGIPRLSESGRPAISDQMSMREFCHSYRELGVEGMAREVYCNLQRTSTRNGILKAEAALRFGQALCDHKVNYFQEVERVLGRPEFERQIQAIPGQRSGISLRYFYMLAGSSAYVKPDRMVERFIRTAIGRTLKPEELHHALVAVCQQLTGDYPRLTPRALDHVIWTYQRRQPVSLGQSGGQE